MQDATGQSIENQLLGKLARALYSSQTPGKFSKEDWEGARAEYRKKARVLLRTMGNQGLELSLPAGK
ncbi:MAG: hypothetical protein ACRBBU_06185 [Pseudooceanicola sp.]